MKKCYSILRCSSCFECFPYRADSPRGPQGGGQGGQAQARQVFQRGDAGKVIMTFDPSIPQITPFLPFLHIVFYFCLYKHGSNIRLAFLMLAREMKMQYVSVGILVMYAIAINFQFSYQDSRLRVPLLN